MRIPYSLVRSTLFLSCSLVGLMMFANAMQRHISRSEGRITRSVPIKSEIRLILAPQALISFARRYPSIEDHDELASRLSEESLDGLWYATVAIDLLSTGEFYRNVSYVYPGRMAHVFPNSKAVLEALKGEPRSFPTQDYQKAKIKILPQEYSTAEPAKILADLVETDR